MAPATSHTFTADCLDDTIRFGRKLGSGLFPGAVLTLDGPLGAGKTHLTRAIAEGLQIEDPNLVTSPTFVLIQEYPARLPIYHFDAYRLQNAADFQSLGADEYLAGQGVCIIEWADRIVEALPDERLIIRIEPLSETMRKFQLTAMGHRYESLISSSAR